jgi:hypothetical protein
MKRPTTRELARKLGYPCTFCKSPEDAAQNLWRLIMDRECGFCEGPAVWLDIVAEMLAEGFDRRSLNHPGCSFSDDWWRRTLGLLRDRLLNRR